MKTFKEVIYLLREKKGFSSHEQVANFLGFSRGGYFTMLNGKGGLKDKTVEKIMDGTNLEAPIIYGAWEAEFGRSKKVRKSWENFLNRVAGWMIAASTLSSEIIHLCILCQIASLALLRKLAKDTYCN